MAKGGILHLAKHGRKVINSNMFGWDAQLQDTVHIAVENSTRQYEYRKSKGEGWFLNSPPRPELSGNWPKSFGWRRFNICQGFNELFLIDLFANFEPFDLGPYEVAVLRGLEGRFGLVALIHVEDVLGTGTVRVEDAIPEGEVLAVVVIEVQVVDGVVGSGIDDFPAIEIGTVVDKDRPDIHKNEEAKVDKLVNRKKEDDKVIGQGL